jgi:UDP-N-acetyl-D-mannosaminuronic acid transferase (WecB/TagA/CpsF family)
MAVGQYLGDGNPDGTSLGKSATEKVSFYGVTPVTQRASASQAAVETTAAISTTSAKWGFSTSTQANAIVSLVNEMRAALVAVGIIKGSA